jgi:hypothetical protein
MVSPEEFANRPSYQRIGLYLAGMVALGAGGGVVIFLALMQMLGWPISLSSAISPVARLSSVEVMLYRSPTTERYFSSVQGVYDVLLKPWREYAKVSGVTLSEVSNLDDLKPRGGRVVVLPSALALSETEKIGLQQYREAGGNLLLTWATGTRNPAGEWSGWEFLNHISGFQLVSELPEDGSLNHLVSLGEGPVTHLLEPGTRIRLGRTTERPVVFKGGPVGGQALATSRKALPNLQEGILMYQELMVPNPSRVAVLGFAETSWEYQLDDMHALISGVLGWLARQPVLFRSHWPEGKSAAYMVAMSMDEKVNEAQHWVQQMAEKNTVPSTFVTASIARQTPDLIRQIAPQVDLAYAGDVPLGFKDQSVSQQQQRIRSMIDETSAVLGQNKVLLGFRAPNNSYDAQTHQTLYEAGIRYHLVDAQEHKSRLPFYATIKNETAGQRFTVLPITLRNDDQIMAEGFDDPTFLRQELLNDFFAVRRQGGLGVLMLHSRLYTSGSVLEKAIPLFVEQIQSESSQVWVSNASQIAQWWGQRERLRLGVRPLGGRTEFDMTVLGTSPYEGAALIVVLPEKGKLPEVRGLKANMPTPKIELIDDYRAVVRFGPLKPDDYSYQLTY